MSENDECISEENFEAIDSLSEDLKKVFWKDINVAIANRLTVLKKA